jgi:hypothetical protein
MMWHDSIIAKAKLLYPEHDYSCLHTIDDVWTARDRYKQIGGHQSYPRKPDVLIVRGFISDAMLEKIRLKFGCVAAIREKQLNQIAEGQG